VRNMGKETNSSDSLIGKFRGKQDKRKTHQKHKVEMAPTTFPPDSKKKKRRRTFRVLGEKKRNKKEPTVAWKMWHGGGLRQKRRRIGAKKFDEIGTQKREGGKPKIGRHLTTHGKKDANHGGVQGREKERRRPIDFTSY